MRNREYILGVPSCCNQRRANSTHASVGVVSDITQISNMANLRL
jgi:hypothetical protein